ncbi:MMPL family transporter [Planctomycetes bacterium K23_9]
MNQPLLQRRSPLGLTYALLILTAFFFLIPSAFRAARLSLGQKENDVKDWLPSDFPETAELNWFADHFAGESFVLATWPGCTSGDKRLVMLEQKLRRETTGFDASVGMPPEEAKQYQRAKKTGAELGLLQTSREHDNWAGLNEKWLATPDGTWYYLTREGRLYRWEEGVNGPAKLIRSIKRKLGRHEVQGTFVTAFGDQKSDGTNPFYNDPSLICASLFQSVQTGDSIAADLSKPDGALWPVDLTEEDRRPMVAKRRAMERLTGTLFAPVVDSKFDWSPDAFRKIISKSQTGNLPEPFDLLVNQTLQRIADDKLDGDAATIATADSEIQSEAFYAVFDALKLTPPPRQTCVMVTLTDLAKENLAFAIGRGVMGGPRGRLLQLAEEAGVQPASPPSVAPPPFNRAEVESLSGAPPLRMGGPPVDNVAIDEEGTITLVRLVGYSILVGIILSYICFGSFKITLMVFIVGGTAAMLSMSFVWWTGGRVDAILMSMPSLVYVLGLSGAIHVINYYRDEVRARGKSGAAGRALRHAAMPCTLASITTAIGLISLHSSNLAPISNFGLYSAIGVIATLAILFSYLPASLEVFAPNFLQETKSVKKDADSTHAEPEEGWLSDAWAAVGRWITGHHALVATVSLVALAIASLGLFKIQTSVQLLKLFDPESRIIRDYAWMEDNFGKLVPMELIVRVPPSMQADTQGQVDKTADASVGSKDVKALSMLERAQTVSRITTVVRKTLGEQGLGVVGQAMSADTFLPPLPAPTNGWWPTISKFNSELLGGRDELLNSDYVRIEHDGPFRDSELWRISLRVGALSDTDYGYFISTLRTVVEPVLRAHDTRDELIAKLAIQGEKRLSGKDKVFVIGRRQPESLATAKLFHPELLTEHEPGDQSTDVGAIDTQAIYLATLNELLAGVEVPKPKWVDLNSLEKPAEVGGKIWNLILSKADAVIWVGDEDLEASDIAGAKHFINAQEIFQKDVHPQLAANNVPDVSGSGEIQAIYTGVIPVVYKAQRTLLSSLVRSIAMAFVLIALVMVVLLNPGRFPMSWLRPTNALTGLAAGSVSMIPNVFPVLLIFGVMGHRGNLVDIGTMMTASVAMGVAVDDTIHFLSWFRSYLDKGMDRVEAVIQTYRRVGPAMTQTTIVGGLGLFVFALSTFTPTQRFGTLMLVLLGAALVGDLILLPALLAGPLGKCFKPRESSTRTKSPVGPSPSGDSPSPDETKNESTDESQLDESSPLLKVHFPKHTRADRPHRVKRN